MRQILVSGSGTPTGIALLALASEFPDMEIIHMDELSEADKLEKAKQELMNIEKRRESRRFVQSPPLPTLDVAHYSTRKAKKYKPSTKERYSSYFNIKKP